MRRASRAPSLRSAIQRHYDSLALPYRVFWGEHIHHGLWESEDATPSAAQERLVAHLAERVDVRPDERVLDVGCGYGASARWLTAKHACHVTGITVSWGQARRVQRLNRRARHRRPVPVVQADAAAIPFAGNAFDVVWVVECSEHLLDKPRFVREAARLLRQSGRIALCAWLRGSGVSTDDPRILAVCEAFLCPSLASADEYRHWSQASGLELVHVEDLTDRVRRTWDVLIARVEGYWLRPLRALAGRDIRRFIRGFRQIAEAYDSGAMSYGLMVARKR
ncbi:MAG: methyltransferase domain-containing protein [Gemmatimonadota bacterium]|nr:MAG: methyltransferase domain-containing protein [Gemmatimonadota bacterium]